MRLYPIFTFYFYYYTKNVNLNLHHIKITQQHQQLISHPLTHVLVYLTSAIAVNHTKIVSQTQNIKQSLYQQINQESPKKKK